MAVSNAPSTPSDVPSSAPRPKVVNVVLTWNDVEMARACLASLRQVRYEPMQTVLVDNGSSFPVMEPLTEAFPEIEPVPLDRNYGFTGGCNRGMERALALEADYVFLLNNDTVVHPDAVSELVHAFEAHPEAGMISALILDLGDEKTIQSYVGFVNRDRARIERPTERQPWTPAFAKTVPTDYCSACAVMFRAEALQQCGLFDETLFTNWEDYDLCMRFADAGYTLKVAGKAEVQHRRHQTTGATSPFITYFGTRNRLICLFRYGRPMGMIRNLPFLLRSLVWTVRGYGLRNWACHRAFFRAWLHFLIGVRGQGGRLGSRDDQSTGKKRT